jgi:thiol-disulfide isomerase/thioredoxin
VCNLSSKPESRRGPYRRAVGSFGAVDPKPFASIGWTWQALASPEGRARRYPVGLAHRRPLALVLFWNPGCGFCQQMLPNLKEWESKAPKDAPRLLVVSAGSEEANREMELTSPVLLDQNFATGRAFGASGTPSAVLVDAEGKVASEVAVGAPAVMELAGADRTT